MLNSRRTLMPILIASAISLQADNVMALVTDVTWEPSSPVMGEIVTYTAIDDNHDPIASYKLEYKYASCGNWITAPTTASSVTFYESRPGTWQIRLTVTYVAVPPNPNPPPDTVIPKSVTIAPATHVDITGLNLTAPVSTPITLRFKLMAGSKECGPYISGVAQELITNRWTLSPPLAVPNPVNDPDWTPDQAVPGVFYLAGNEIVDVKGQPGMSQVWGQIPPNTAYYTMTQSLRLKYTDPCGDEQIIPLGSYSIRRFKDPNGNWAIVSP